MGQATPAGAFRRLAICVLVAALAIGTTTPPSVAESSPPDKRTYATSDPSTTVPDHPGPSGIWSFADHEPDATPSFFQSWLISLQSTIKLAFAYAWNLGRMKPDNTCS